MGKRKRLEVQRAADPIYGDHAHKHQDTARQSEDQELYRSIDAPRTSPNADEQKDGNEYELPENEEEKKIGCGK